MPTNDENAAKGRAAVAAAAPDNHETETETAVTDTLANIMHFCNEEGIDFSECESSAAMHFNAEVFEELPGRDG